MQLVRYIYVFLLIMVFSYISKAQSSKKIEIKNANSLEYDESLGKNVRRLIGNVVFQHERAMLYCDSAYMFSNENRLEAFGNIHLIQNDSIHLYGKFLKYDGNARIAEICNDVRLTDNTMTLYTELLFFNRNTNIAFYPNNGRIVDKLNKLRSNVGYYYSNTQDMYFRKQVVLINREYTMNSDTLKYNTRNEIAYFYGPTTIVSDSSVIYCENGWYNTRTDVSQFNRNAFLKNKTQTLKGDSIYYNKRLGIGKAFCNVVMTDTVENIVLKGDYAIYYEKPEQCMITDSALFIQFADGDTLYLHADTLRYYSDSLGKSELIKAYYKVKFFKDNIQGKCDSLVYVFSDSSIILYREPVLWSDKNQLTAEKIIIQTANNKIHLVEMLNTALIIQQNDTLRYNQIKGRQMTGYFANEKIYKVFVNGNGETIYFPKDGDEIIGINRAEGSNIIIGINDNEIERITIQKKPDGIMHPPDNIQVDGIKLKGFIWLNEYRPLNKEEIFLWKKKE